MLALAVVLALGVALGFVRRGSFDNLRTARLRGMPLIFGALGLQLVADVLVPRSLSTLAFVLVLLSFGCIFWWAALNVRAAGMAFIAVGAAMNFVVIAANQGMPISAEAARRSGYSGELDRLVVRGKHLIDADDTAKLRFLGDWIPLGGQPSAASVGDLVLWAGLVLLLQDLIAGPRGRRSVRPEEPPGAPEIRTASADGPTPDTDAHVRVKRGPHPHRGA